MPSPRYEWFVVGNPGHSLGTWIKTRRPGEHCLEACELRKGGEPSTIIDYTLELKITPSNNYKPGKSKP